MNSTKPYITLDEYFGLEERSDVKHEYYAGAVHAMTGASYRHNLIVANIIGALYAQLRGKPCTVYASDLHVKVERTRLYTYPDVSVVCGPLQFEQRRTDTITNPTLLVEVLSPSTEDYDRGKSFSITAPSKHCKHISSSPRTRFMLSTIDATHAANGC